MENMKINPDYPDITCEYGYYPYCLLCEHGRIAYPDEIDDECAWLCMLDNEED